MTFHFQGFFPFFIGGYFLHSVLFIRLFISPYHFNKPGQGNDEDEVGYQSVLTKVTNLFFIVMTPMAMAHLEAKGKT